MRVCHVSPHLPPDQAANALLPAELGSWARARGDDVTFVSHEPAQGRTALNGTVAGEWRIPRRQPASGLTRALRIDSFRQLRAVGAALERAARNVDLIHLHSNGLIIEAAAAWAARRAIPYVLTLYGTEIWHYRARWPIDPFTRAYRRAGEVTFYSRRLLDRARELGLDRTGLSVVYPAYSSAFAPLDSASRAGARTSLGIDEPIVLLNVKRLHELAGQRYLIDAFARLTRGRHDLRLVICGTGPLREALEAQARHAGIRGKVTFTGLVSNDVVARYAAVAHVFALPSLLEALPTVAVEALASGTPVVSADHPGGVELHEIFGDDVAVVPKQNVERLAEALAEAIARPRRVRAVTLELVRQHFSPAAVQAAYDAVYNRVRRDAAGRPAS
jgi:glycosyltransferase involved in cell wall biosynthesis